MFFQKKLRLLSLACVVMAGMVSGGKADEQAKTPGYIVLATVIEGENETVQAEVKEILVWNRNCRKDDKKKDAYVIKDEYKKNGKPSLQEYFPKDQRLTIHHTYLQKSAKVLSKKWHALINKRVELVVAKDKKTVLRFEQISTAALAKRKLTPRFGNARRAVHKNHVEIANALWTGDIAKWTKENTPPKQAEELNETDSQGSEPKASDDQDKQNHGA